MRRQCSRCPNEEGAADGRTKHADIPANAPAFHQQDRRYLQELREEWNCCKHAYGEVVSTKRYRKTNQEYARSEGAHGLAGEGIEKDEPEDAAIFAVGGLG